jgi:hypothetical protein
MGILAAKMHDVGDTRLLLAQRSYHGDWSLKHKVGTNTTERRIDDRIPMNTIFFGFWRPFSISDARHSPFSAPLLSTI